MMHKYQISLYNCILGVRAATGYHAIAVITEWDLYRELD
jgi:hypothetical protein